MRKKGLFAASLTVVFFSLAAFLIWTQTARVVALTPARSQTGEKQASVTAVPVVRMQGQVVAQYRFGTNFLTTDQGNNLLVLVDKKVGLPADFVPENLVSIDGILKTFKAERLRSDAADVLKKLIVAAGQDGVQLGAVSSYRSYQDQVVTFNGWVASAGLTAAETFSARPGHSQHQLGTTIDFSTLGGVSLGADFGNTKEGRWLAENAYRFGFVLSYPSGKESITGYSYEPWHFRYIGETDSRKMTALGVTLEEYLQTFGTW